MLRKSLVALFALALYLFIPASAFSATCTWSGGAGNWDNSNTASWSCGHVPVAADSVVFDGSSGGGTITVCGASSANCPNGAGVVTVTTLTTSAFTGTVDFATNNPNVTLSSQWIDAATGAHTVNLGNGTWTFSGAAGSLLAITAGANLTLNANGSTLSFTGTPTGAVNVGLGNHTYNTISLPNVTNGQCHVIQGTNTIATLNKTGGGCVEFTTNTTQTITNAFNWAGTSSNALLIQGTAGTVATIAAGAASTMDWAAISHMTFTSHSVTVTDGLDTGGNTFSGGGGITPPSGGAFILGGNG